jgi:hypothetical protein
MGAELVLGTRERRVYREEAEAIAEDGLWAIFKFRESSIVPVDESWTQSF